MNVQITNRNVGVFPYLRQYSLLKQDLFFSIDLHYNYLTVFNEGNLITELQLVDEAGTTFYNEPPLEKEKVSIPIQPLNEGTYFLNIVTPSESFTRKIYIG